MTKFITKVAVKYSNLFTKLDDYLYPNSVIVLNKARELNPLSIVNATPAKGLQKLLIVLSSPQLNSSLYKNISIMDMILYMDLDKLIKTMLYDIEIFKTFGLNLEGRNFKLLINNAIKDLLDINKNLCAKHLKTKEAIYIATKL